MAATVSVKRRTGTSGAPTNTTVTGDQLGAADVANPGTSAHQLVIPTSGINRSYWASYYLNADTAPATGLSNFKFYTDGSSGLGTGVTLYAGTTATYTQATGVTDSTGDDSSVATVDAFTYTSGSPLSVGGSIAATTGKASDFVVLQIDVATTASAGVTATETLTIRYDET